jgi:arginine exporter protein ArgO
VGAIFFCWYGITLPKQAKNGKKKRASAEMREKWQKKRKKGKNTGKIQENAA